MKQNDRFKKKRFSIVLFSMIFILLLGSRVFAADLEYVNVKTYGAKGVSGSDDLGAIHSAITACESMVGEGIKPVLYFPPAAGYHISEQVYVSANISVRMEAPLVYTGSGNNVTVLTVGDNDNASVAMDHKLNVTRSSRSGWTSEDGSSISIVVKNIFNSKINIVQANNSAIGVQFLGNGYGVAYNTVQLGYLNNNKIGVDLASNAAGGYVNENLFLKGRFSIDGDLVDDKGLYSNLYVGEIFGIRITSLDETYIYNNNNLFLHPSFELGPGGIPVFIEHGQNNEIIGARSEGNSETYAVTDNGSLYNRINFGYSGGGVIENRGDYDAVIVTRRSDALTDAPSVVFDSGNIRKGACYYDGNFSINIPRVHLVTDNNDSFKRGTHVNGIYFDGEYIRFPSPRGVGIFIDSTINKKFTVQRTVHEPEGDPLVSRGGRIAVKCYDASGSLLAGGAHVIAQSSAMSISSSDDWGGCYITGADSGGVVSFAVIDSVKKIEVLVTSGSGDLILKSFKVLARHASAAWPGYEQIIPGVNLGKQAPTAGTWEHGKLVLNHRKEELGTAGSKYVIEGWEYIVPDDQTPGTWIEKRSLTGN